MATTPVPGGGGTGSGYVPPDTGPVTPHEIYALMTQRGFSTNQAIGVMANMINESGLNPEAQNPGGPAAGVGLVQWETTYYPGAASLVTGNPQQDVRAQITYLAQTASKQSLSGDSATAVAGNFARYFEKCAGCQPGGSQYKSRVANVAQLEAALKSGNWGTVTGSSVGGSGSSSSSSTSAQTSTCLISAPSVLGFGGGCLFSKTNARAIIGGLVFGAGGLTAFAGLAILTASAFSHTKAGQAAGKAAGSVLEGAGAVAAAAGAPEIGAPVAAAGSGLKRSPGRAGKYAQGKRTRARQDKAEDAELRAKGASDIRTARRPQPRPNRPGRVTESQPGPNAGRRPQPRRQREREEVPF